jgi:FKBP-type peptidyl-prolyl cis-trans isomerase FklB
MNLFDKLNQAKQDKLAKTLQEGLEFLEKNKKRDEVICLESGLQYEILQAGEGPKPTASDTVTCHYHGTLIDGRVFDSSVQRGSPASFPLNRVIAGWTEAVQLMPVGSKWRLYLPPHLAYGDRQMGALIQPNSSLIFEVELLGF